MSDPTPDSEIERLLEQALDLPADARERFLQRACGADSALHARLTKLLVLADAGGGFLERSPLRAAESPDNDAPPRMQGQPIGHTIGPYRIERLLGAGGMGEVYLAERIEGGFRQRVALKLVRRDVASAPQHFDGERQILADLEHPGIARLYDGGISADGQPYMAMEFIEGRDLLAYCVEHKASLEERLSLFLQVCEAVSYAHAHLVVHRDLKPANIFVTAEGRTKLLDFGIAKLLQTNVVGDATRTAHLSAAYAAPEQLTGATITTATDVYALGATLFQLLTGRLPWLVSDMPLASAVQRLLDEAPPRLSTVDHTGAPVPSKRLRGDLDAIVAKALRKEPRDRYPDARAFSDDLWRHLRHEPVQARLGARTYVVRRFLRRHWMPLSAAALVFIALIAGIAGIAWQAERARAQATRAEAIKDFVLSVFIEQDPFKRDQSQALTPKQLLGRAVERIDAELAGQSQARAELLSEFGEIQLNIGDSESARALLERALRETRALRGGDSVEGVAIMQHLAEALSDQGEVAAAEATLREALAILRARDAMDTLTAAGVMATLAYQLNQKQPGSAEEQQLIAAALRIDEAVLGPDDIETSKLLARQAHMLMVARDDVRAEAVAREALARIERAQGPDTVWMHRPLITLGRIAEAAKRWPDAQNYYARAVDVLRRHTDGANVQLSTALILLSGCYREQGDLTTAMSVLDQAEQALPVGERVMQTNIYSERGQLSADLGDNQKAELWLHKAYDARREQLGERHRATLATAGMWGVALAKLDRLDEAEAVQRKALSDMQAALGADSPYLESVKRGLAETLRRQGRVEEAQALIGKTDEH